MENDEFSFQEKAIRFIRANMLVSALFLGGVIFLGVGLIQFLGRQEGDIEFKQGEAVEAASTSGEIDHIVVDISGEVEKPGVYELEANARIQDALVAAGGLSRNADRDLIAKKVNLASRLSDGTKIYIPRIGEAVETSSGGIASGGEASSGLPSINSASSSELEALPSIGAVTAGKIIDGRPYSSVEELLSRKILGKSTYTKIKDLVGL